ncbi:MAG: hypothetical protein H0X29_06155 [Parachlamydiaceae bacterium]|nr:hypothetical protein [Parachlamydiaceae bacterium]
MLMCFCGAMLTNSLLCADEVNEDGHVPVGSRALPVEEHVAQNEARTKLYSLDLQVDAQLPEGIKVAAEESDVKGVRKMSKGNNAEEVTQHDMFYTSHPGAFHRPYSIGYSGDTVEFEDGSVWSVKHNDALKTLNWLATDLIVVTPNRSWLSSHDFRLTNQNTGVSVQASLTLGPIYNAPFTHWIVGIDYYNNTVYLEDGTVWKMSYFTENSFRNWVVNDTVIIGINDGWLSYTSPNILINVNMLDYAAGIVAH